MPGGRPRKRLHHFSRLQDHSRRLESNPVPLNEGRQVMNEQENPVIPECVSNTVIPLNQGEHTSNAVIPSSQEEESISNAEQIISTSAIDIQANSFNQAGPVRASKLKCRQKISEIGQMFSKIRSETISWQAFKRRARESLEERFQRLEDLRQRASRRLASESIQERRQRLEEQRLRQKRYEMVKREFFKYFQMGLSVSDAKNKYAMRYRKKSLRSKHTPTLRQTQHLYNQWKGVKGWSTLEEGYQIESQPKPLTFQEILDAVPKKEILYLQSETDTPVKSNTECSNKGFKFPLVFISVGSAAAMPSSTAPLLYKLKHGIAGELLSDLFKPRIYSISIDSVAPVVVEGQLTEPSQSLQNSFEPASDEILGISLPVDEANLPVKAVLNETLNIPIKMEPLNVGYEDEHSQGSTEKIEDTSMLPIITQAFSCGDATTTEEIDIKPNICCGDSIIEEVDIKPNICCDEAGNSFFPLVFTLKGSIYEASCGRSLVYDLKQGLTGVQATEIVIPQISSVQINSLNEAAFQFKYASMLKTEEPLSVSVQVQ